MKMNIITFSLCVLGSLIASSVSGHPASFGGLVFGVYLVYIVGTIMGFKE